MSLVGGGQDLRVSAFVAWNLGESASKYEVLCRKISVSHVELEASWSSVTSGFYECSSFYDHGSAGIAERFRAHAVARMRRSLN